MPSITRISGSGSPWKLHDLIDDTSAKLALKLGNSEPSIQAFQDAVRSIIGVFLAKLPDGEFDGKDITTFRHVLPVGMPWEGKVYHFVCNKCPRACRYESTEGVPMKACICTNYYQGKDEHGQPCTIVESNFSQATWQLEYITGLLESAPVQKYPEGDRPFILTTGVDARGINKNEIVFDRPLKASHGSTGGKHDCTCTVVGHVMTRCKKCFQCEAPPLVIKELSRRQVKDKRDRKFFGWVFIKVEARCPRCGNYEDEIALHPH